MLFLSCLILMELLLKFLFLFSHYILSQVDWSYPNQLFQINFSWTHLWKLQPQNRNKFNYIQCNYFRSHRGWCNTLRQNLLNSSWKSQGSSLLSFHCNTISVLFKSFCLVHPNRLMLHISKLDSDGILLFCHFSWIEEPCFLRLHQSVLL